MPALMSVRGVITNPGSNGSPGSSFSDRKGEGVSGQASVTLDITSAKAAYYAAISRRLTAVPMYW